MQLLRVKHPKTISFKSNSFAHARSSMKAFLAHNMTPPCHHTSFTHKVLTSNKISQLLDPNYFVGRVFNSLFSSSLQLTVIAHFKLTGRVTGYRMNTALTRPGGGR